VKKLSILLFLAVLLSAGGCSRNHRVLVLQWQKPTSEVCLACQKCGVSEKEIEKACVELQKQLAPKGIEVKLGAEKTGDPQTPTAGGMYICDVPLEVWLSGESLTDPCENAQKRGNPEVMRRTFWSDGQSYEIVPADLIVKAGMRAADMLQQLGKIDPGKIPTPKKCAGCPSRSTCGQAKHE
jgi:hypothetical protein